MSDVIPANDVAQPAAPEPPTRPPPMPEPSPVEKHPGFVFAGRALLWIAVMAVGVVTLAPIVRFALVEIGDQSLAQANDTTVRQKLLQPLPKYAPADYFETIGELAMDVKPAQPEVALRAMKRAVDVDPSRAFAWANIAWLETAPTGHVTPEAEQALEASMRACTMCDLDLVGWRFNFVLSHWAEIPEATRRMAFEQADILRWKGDRAEFLAGMRIRAEAVGIPYAAYRAAVNTPVRKWEVALPVAAPAAPATPAP